MKKLILPLAICFSLGANAQEDALAKTQQLLLDQRARESIIAHDQKAKATDEFADKTVNGNPEDKERLYQLASQALTYLAHKHDGDVSKMQKDMEKALKNPEQFKNDLPPELVQQIEDLAHKVEANKR